MLWDLPLHYLVALVAIVNPLGKVPVWLRLSERENAGVRRRLAVMLVGTGLGLLTLMLLFGENILSTLGIDLASFQIGGGIVVAVTGLSMLRGQLSEADFGDLDDHLAKLERARQRFRQGVFPMVIPMIAGPGALVTATIYGSRSEGAWQTVALAGVTLLVMLAIFGVLLAARWIERAIGKTALNVQTRVFGMILIALAVQMSVEGAGKVFPRLVDGRSEITDDLREDQPRRSRETGGVERDQ